MLLVDDHEPQRLDRARRPPSAARPPLAPRRNAAAPLVAALAGRQTRSEAAPPARPGAPRKRASVCGVSAISGTSAITPAAPLERRLGRRRDRPRSCPSRSRRAAAARPRRRRGRRRSPRPPGPLVGVQLDAARRRADDRDLRPAAHLAPRGPRRTRAGPVAAARRDRVPRSAAASSAPAASSRAEHLALTRAQTDGAVERRAARRRDLRPQLELRAGRACPRETVPGGSTSSRPRAGVEQYSLRHPEPETDQLRRDARGDRPHRLDQTRRVELAGFGHVDDHPKQAARAERNDQDAADAHVAEAVRERVVERPAQGTGSGQRLDPRNRHRA